MKIIAMLTNIIPANIAALPEASILFTKGYFHDKIFKANDKYYTNDGIETNLSKFNNFVSINSKSECKCDPTHNLNQFRFLCNICGLTHKVIKDKIVPPEHAELAFFKTFRFHDKDAKLPTVINSESLEEISARFDACFYCWLDMPEEKRRNFLPMYDKSIVMDKDDRVLYSYNECFYQYEGNVMTIPISMITSCDGSMYAPLPDDVTAEYFGFTPKYITMYKWKSTGGEAEIVKVLFEELKFSHDYGRCLAMFFATLISTEIVQGTPLESATVVPYYHHISTLETNTNPENAYINQVVIELSNGNTVCIKITTVSVSVAMLTIGKYCINSTDVICVLDRVLRVCDELQE